MEIQKLQTVIQEDTNETHLLYYDLNSFKEECPSVYTIVNALVPEVQIYFKNKPRLRRTENIVFFELSYFYRNTAENFFLIQQEDILYIVFENFSEDACHSISEKITAYEQEVKIANRLIDSGDIIRALLFSDSDQLLSIEEMISIMEEKVLKSTQIKDVPYFTAKNRKYILRMKQYYTLLDTLVDEIIFEEVLSENEMKRAQYLLKQIDHLRMDLNRINDSLIILREMYQSEKDLELNSSMKFLTVVSTIFLPLTLLVGWYGMNLKMPEFTWRHGYSIISLIALAIIILSLVLLKKLGLIKR